MKLWTNWKKYDWLSLLWAIYGCEYCKIGMQMCAHFASDKQYLLAMFELKWMTIVNGGKAAKRSSSYSNATAAIHKTIRLECVSKNRWVEKWDGEALYCQHIPRKLKGGGRKREILVSRKSDRVVEGIESRDTNRMRVDCRKG